MSNKASLEKPIYQDIPAEGHNSTVCGGLLLQLIERVEEFETERLDAVEAIREVYLHAKSVGFDVKIMRKCIALRKREKAEREEEAELVDTYMFALSAGDE